MSPTSPLASDASTAASDSRPSGHDWENHMNDDETGYGLCRRCQLVAFYFPDGMAMPDGFVPIDESDDDCLSRQVLGT